MRWLSDMLCDQCGVSASYPENIGARQDCLQRFVIMLSYGTWETCLSGRQKERAFSVKAKPRAALVFCQCARIARVREDGVS